MDMKRERLLWGSALAVSVFVVGLLLVSPSDTTALVDALNSRSEAANELIWIQEQRLHIQDELIRVQGEQISDLKRQISTFESLVEGLETRESLLNSLSTTSETQPQ